MGIASQDAIKQLSALVEEVDGPLKVTFKNIHMGYPSETLVRFLKAREWSIPKAHKMGQPVFAIGVGLSTYDKASPAASKKYGRHIGTCVKVLDMTGVKLSALNQLKIVDYASLPHFCKREGSGSSRHSTSGSDDCFSLDHPFHQQLYNYIKQQVQEYVAPLKQGSFHVDVPEPDLEGIKIVKTIESELHKIGDRNGLDHSPSDLKIDRVDDGTKSPAALARSHISRHAALARDAFDEMTDCGPGDDGPKSSPHTDDDGFHESTANGLRSGHIPRRAFSERCDLFVCHNIAQSFRLNAIADTLRVTFSSPFPAVEDMTVVDTYFVVSFEEMTEIRFPSVHGNAKEKVGIKEPMQFGSSSSGGGQIDRTYEEYAGLVSDDDDYWRAGSFREADTTGDFREHPVGEISPSMNQRTEIETARSSSRDSDARLLNNWMEIVQHRMTTASRSRRSHNRAPCTIYEVPANIRKHDTEAYQPKVVAIGPYHREKTGLQVTVDDKWRCLRDMLSFASPRFSEEENQLRIWIENIKDKEELARSCYSRDANMDSYSFVEMLLLDGCFLLHVLLMVVKKTEVVVEDPRKEESNEVDGKSGKMHNEECPLVGVIWQWNLIKLDLLLLENQIPFFIIQDLFDHIMNPGIKHISIPHLALELFDELHPKMNKDMFQFGPDGNGILHLLHLFHSAMVPSPNYRMTDTECWNPNSPSSSSMQHLHIPSATELGESAVRFRRKDHARSFLEVAFCNGELEIPTLHIFDYSNALFRNLISFEQCYPGVSPYITAYASFMECIMHRERDVRLLHLSGTVVNRLSTDKDVAVFFKQICYQVSQSCIPGYLSPLYKKVSDHHKHQWRRWNAELKRHYFSNPWVTLSVIAAIILLCLNFIQTLLKLK
ncbi:hypothetical protein MUK42_01179 [Musa troglodytarum]|uniref:CRAL/TRIO N-terminal domain-containing protein n=1 Tax=Musa troglodytarum TaxID=320322 RepID=A0A9E7JT27_9LILI|nr:hypothetical protein MUK42_01179 [Musa troglodytarum]